VVSLQNGIKVVDQYRFYADMTSILVLDFLTQITIFPAKSTQNGLRDINNFKN
jgi:hypothetical protein